MRCIVALGAFGTTWLCAMAALACGQLQAPYLTIESVTPNGDAGFPRDGAIQIRTKVWRLDSPPESHVNFVVRVSRVDDGTEVAGALDSLYPENGPVTWTPDAKLAANTQYRVEVSTTTEPLATIDAPTSLTTTFRTSDELAPDLELGGDLHVALRAGMLPNCSFDDCGVCTPSGGDRPALFMNVDIPYVTGGFDWFGYRSAVVLTADEPAQFDGPGAGAESGQVHVVAGPMLDPGLPKEISFEISRGAPSLSFAACVALNVWDPIGHTKSASICVPVAEVDAAFAELYSDDAVSAMDAGTAPRDAGRVADVADAAASSPDAAGSSSAVEPDTTAQDAADAGAADRQASTDKHSSGGCSAVPGVAAPVPHALLALIVAGLARRRSRAARCSGHDRDPHPAAR